MQGTAILKAFSTLGLFKIEYYLSNSSFTGFLFYSTEKNHHFTGKIPKSVRTKHLTNGSFVPVIKDIS